jgi:hypothetical protein
MPDYKQYDPKKVTVNVGGITARSFADGAMVTVAMDTDANTVHVGTDGDGRHIKSANRSGQVTIRLASYSVTNSAFQLLYATDQPFPITIADKSSNGRGFFASSCKWSKVPDLSAADAETAVEWVANFIRGGINQAGAVDL